MAMARRARPLGRTGVSKLYAVGQIEEDLARESCRGSPLVLHI